MWSPMAFVSLKPNTLWPLNVGSWALYYCGMISRRHRKIYYICVQILGDFGGHLFVLCLPFILFTIATFKSIFLFRFCIRFYIHSYLHFYIHFHIISTTHSFNMPFFMTTTKLILLGAILGGTASAYPNTVIANDTEIYTFPDVVPGPGMPNLESIGETSTTLYIKAFALLGTSRSSGLDELLLTQSLRPCHRC